ncbi:hypothetical protein CANCADRAFT_31227 [Tortispora caseinolytica NRRL Y-17796]|uniref:U3 small nucleolar RNA-associated protein 14 n=1 Tax=Tortispora caseinolytica NRRL Y-17796 TaxID=767744 RepID=A0A1E4TEK4_9ASCO|nr:hypothetical protein CANCADRAFT_31227 [Tortispora caseinolytica NRRL Y-17796]
MIQKLIVMKRLILKTRRSLQIGRFAEGTDQEELDSYVDLTTAFDMASESSDNESSGLSDDNESESVTDDETGNMLMDAISSFSGQSNVQNDTQTTDPTKLSIDDLFANVADSTLRDSLSRLDKIRGSTKTKVLKAPEVRSVRQERNRAAAYQITRDEVSRWDDTVRQNRSAEHLTFPINPESLPSLPDLTAPRDIPTSGLEKDVTDVLEQSQLYEEKEATFEQLAEKNLSPEELIERRNKLRIMRDLMFREERKAKRLAKIKSKAYRRIRKKERLRQEEINALDEESGSDDEARLAERAKERMTLRHKNSNWAKRMVSQGITKDSESRKDYEEMLLKGAQLKTRMLGNDEPESSDENISDVSDDEPEVKNGSNKSLLNMKFMVDAREREKEANAKMRLELERMQNDASHSDASDEEILLTEGIRRYGNTANSLKRKRPQPSESAEVDNLSDEQEFKGFDDEETKSDVPEPTGNPWLAISSSETGKSATQRRKVARESKDTDSGAIVQTSNQLQMSTHETNGLRTTNLIQMSQKELIKEAFAGDDVVREFEEEKRQLAEEDADKLVDTAIPGWGSWAGDGLTTKPRIVTKKGIVNPRKREDRNLKGVIINERINKKNMKYNSSEVPFPFETREQYERSLRIPMIKEASAITVHQKSIKPRIIVKPGRVIDPLKAPFK